MITYDLQIVGGGFDGAPELKWRDDGKHPPPASILVGVCSKGMDCGTVACRRTGSHVSYWLLDEAGCPAGAQSYSKQEEFVARDEGELAGRVVYAVGGLLDPSNFGEAAREPLQAGFTPPACVA